MPYSNSISITQGGLGTIAEYLVSADHSHHVEYELTPIKVFGAKSVEEFIAGTKAALHANKRNAGRMRVGRQPKNVANWIVVRTPDGTWLSDDERTAYEETAREEAGHGSSVLGIMNWHKNRLNGASDLNILAATFSKSGVLMRDRTKNPIKSLRQRMDCVTEALNVLRNERGISLIQTMQEAQQNVRRQRGAFVIEEKLVLMPKPPRKVSELKPALLSIECEVPRFQFDCDSVWIVKPTKKKKKGESKRYCITGLLRAVEVRLLTRRPDVKAPEPLEITATLPAQSGEKMSPLATSQTPVAKPNLKFGKKKSSVFAIPIEALEEDSAIPDL
jgi:hypothetical protein